MTTNIDYKRGQAQQQIEAVNFQLNNEKSLKLSVVDIYDEAGERIVSQSLKALIKDSSFGDEELFVELDVNDGTDLVRILQRMLRQIHAFRPEENSAKTLIS